MELDGSAVSSILLAVGALLTYLISQASTRARDQRRRLRRLTKRDILWSGWSHKVLVWAASNGHEDIPKKPPLLDVDEEDEEDA